MTERRNAFYCCPVCRVYRKVTFKEVVELRVRIGEVADQKPFVDCRSNYHNTTHYLKFTTPPEDLCDADTLLPTDAIVPAAGAMTRPLVGRAVHIYKTPNGELVITVADKLEWALTQPGWSDLAWVASVSSSFGPRRVWPDPAEPQYTRELTAPLLFVYERAHGDEPAVVLGELADEKQLELLAGLHPDEDRRRHLEIQIVDPKYAPCVVWFPAAAVRS